MNDYLINKMIGGAGGEVFVPTGINGDDKVRAETRSIRVFSFISYHKASGTRVPVYALLSRPDTYIMEKASFFTRYAASCGEPT